MTGEPAPLVVLLRHAQTAWNADHRFQGQHDTDLTAEGHAQADEAALHVAAATAGRRLVLVSSDLRRARDTAVAVGRATGAEPLLDPRLREVAAGSWQGLLHPEIEALDPEGHAAWRAGDDIRLGGAETPTEAGGRVLASVAEHAAGLGPGAVLVAVGHGASIRAGLALLLGQPDLRRVLVPLGNTGTAVLAPAVDPPVGAVPTPDAPPWRLHGWNVPPSGLGELLGRHDVPSAAPV